MTRTHNRETGQTEYARCKAAFLGLLDAHDDDRARAVERVCGGDTGLSEQLGRMLRQHERIDAALDSPCVLSDDEGPAVDLADEPLRPGEQLGRYTVLARLDAGAMGIVYEARQEGTERTVALKVVRPEWVSARAHRRFAVEGRALARLRHPGIAQVYEAGVASVGAHPVPFIAMELVRGRPISAAAAGLPLATKLGLLVQACDAVHHAHLCGVVHRDLKPANVLVEDAPAGAPDRDVQSPRVKVLDFGVAKLTEDDEARTTVDGQLVGTPAYMSPEQLAGQTDRIDHRADVYALGVLLYELLAGRRPREAEGGGVLAAVRCIEQPPARLSVLDRALRGDLETIAGKALERDPERRYQSAAELGEDIRRFLSHQPIRARRPTRLYLANRFVRRNPWPVALGVAAAAILVAGSAGVAIKARQARAAELRSRQHFDGLRGFARTMLYEVHDLIAALPGSTNARGVLAEAIRAQLDSISRDPHADDRLLLDTAEAYVRLGDVQGYPHLPNLGDMKAAAESYARAIAILDPLHARAPADVRTARALALAILRRREVHSGEDTTQTSRAEYERVLDLTASLARAHPDDPDVAAEHVNALLRVALSATELGLPPDLEGLRVAVEAAEAAASRGLRSPALSGIHAEALFRLGERQIGAGDEAGLTSLGAALAMCESAIADGSADAAVLYRLAAVHGRIALAHATRGHRPNTELHAAESIAHIEAASGADPTDWQACRGVGVMHIWAAEAWEALAASAPASPELARRDLESAVAHYRAALANVRARAERGWLGFWEIDCEAEPIAGIERCLARLRELDG